MTAAAEASPDTAPAYLRRALALALLLALVSLPLAAQTPQPAQQPPLEQQAEEPDPEAAEPALEAPAIGEATPAESEDPFDYEASEQISEDLSVSFPVDI